MQNIYNIYTKMGSFLMMAVLGLVIAMVINMFVGSGPLDTIISVVGMLIFTASFLEYSRSRGTRSRMSSARASCPMPESPHFRGLQAWRQ